MVADSSTTPPPTETEDLTGVVWNDRIWLSMFPLNNETVLDYFSLSQFYDSRCNNEQIKMQRLDPALLSTMPGIEYKLADTPAPGLFIITKSMRSITPPKLEPLATYYVHDGNIYQAPTLHAVLSSRVLQSLHHLRGAFECMQGAVVLSARGRYVWDPPPGGEVVEEKEVVSRAERNAVDRMLYDVLEKNRAIWAEYEEKAAEGEREGGQTGQTG